MRLDAELLDAFWEMSEAIRDVRRAVTRKQHQRLEEGIAGLRVIIGVLPERPLVEPPTDEGA
jgi:hypothetical protein